MVWVLHVCVSQLCVYVGVMCVCKFMVRVLCVCGRGGACECKFMVGVLMCEWIMVWVLHVCVSQLCVYVGVMCVSVSSWYGMLMCVWC